MSNYDEQRKKMILGLGLAGAADLWLTLADENASPEKIQETVAKHRQDAPLIKQLAGNAGVDFGKLEEKLRSIQTGDQPLSLERGAIEVDDTSSPAADASPQTGTSTLDSYVSNPGEYLPPKQILIKLGVTDEKILTKAARSVNVGIRDGNLKIPASRRKQTNPHAFSLEDVDSVAIKVEKYVKSLGFLDDIVSSSSPPASSTGRASDGSNKSSLSNYIGRFNAGEKTRNTQFITRDLIMNPDSPLAKLFDKGTRGYTIITANIPHADKIVAPLLDKEGYIKTSSRTRFGLTSKPTPPPTNPSGGVKST